MIEVVEFEEATAEKLSEADVIMAIGYGSPYTAPVLFGRDTFARVAGNKQIAADYSILRIKIRTDEELEELKSRVKQAKGELDPGQE